jgi:Protein of unknown function (DUF3592)
VRTTEGRSYRASGYDGSESYTSDRAGKQAIVDRYTIGQRYPCWYNPAHPTQAILVRQPNWVVILIGGGFLLLGALFATVGITRPPGPLRASRTLLVIFLVQISSLARYVSACAQAEYLPSSARIEESWCRERRRPEPYSGPDTASAIGSSLRLQWGCCNERERKANTSSLDELLRLLGSHRYTSSVEHPTCLSMKRVVKNTLLFSDTESGIKLAAPESAPFHEKKVIRRLALVEEQGVLLEDAATSREAKSSRSRCTKMYLPPSEPHNTMGPSLTA